MKSLGRRVAAAVALSTIATALVVLSTAGPTGAAETLRCESVLGGVTPTDRLRFLGVVNGKVIGTRSTTTPLPFRPSALAFKSYQANRSLVTVGSYAIHPSGTPRVIGAKYVPGSTKMSWTSRVTTTSGFLPRLFAGSGDHYFAVSDTGVLSRRDVNLQNGKGVGTGYGNLTALQWASVSRNAAGKLVDILYATTDSGGLIQLQVPYGDPAVEKVTTLRTSGYAGVTGLSTGWCNQTSNRHVINAVFAGENRATWTTVSNAIGASPSNTTPRGALGVGGYWTLGAVH